MRDKLADVIYSGAIYSGICSLIIISVIYLADYVGIIGEPVAIFNYFLYAILAVVLYLGLITVTYLIVILKRLLK